MPLIFLDTETTGLNPEAGQEIIEIAIITEYSNGNVETWETKIKPQRINKAHPKALEINGYNETDWKDAPKMEEAVLQIYERLQHGIVIGYNPHFDWRFITKAFEEYGLDIPYRVRCLDVMVLVWEHLLPKGLKYLSLDAVRDFLGWDKAGSHSALKDTQDTRKLYHLLMGMKK